MELGAEREPARCQARLGAGGPRTGRGHGSRPRRHAPDDLAEHELDDPVLRARGHIHDADGLALAQHSRPVADGGDLDHPVGDEDDGALSAALAADDLEDALGEVRRQGRGHLVEHEDVRLDREGAGKVDDPERGERHAPRQARQVEVLEPELAEPVAERLHRCLGQAQVGADVQVRDERRLLVDRDEPAAAGFGRVMDRALPAPYGDRARVGPDRTGEDLDERALAGAVGAHERVDLARAHGQRGGLQRHDGAVGLRDARGLEQEVGGGDGHRFPEVRRRGRGCRRTGIPRAAQVRGATTPRRGPCRRWPARGCRSSSPRS